MSLIRLENVNKIYNTEEGEFFALRDCSLDIEAGDFVIIRGESGSGKSTLLNIVGAIDEPTSGKYYYNDVCMSKLNDEKKSKFRREKIGFVFQDYMLIQKQTVLYNVMVPLLFGKDTLKKCKEKAILALRRVGMEKFANRKAFALSGGQKQRIAIARAIVNNPDVILADEPTGALDGENSTQIFEIIKSLNQDGVTVLFVTHNESYSVPNEKCYRIADGKLM